MTVSRRGGNAGGWLWLGGATLGVPILLARVPLGASWRVIGIAYAIWIGLLATFALGLRGSGSGWAEATGWPAIMSFFWTIPVVVGITMILVLAGVD